MKKITAIIRSDKLKDVEKVLREAGAPGFTFFNVRGHGRESESYLVSMPELPEFSSLPPTVIYADVLPKVKVEVVCKDEDAQRISSAIGEVSKSGIAGDGIIYIEDIDRVVRILSGEEGTEAL